MPATPNILRRSPLRVPRPGGLLAGMRIRKKLVVLHTCFSLGLAAILALALRPAISEVIRQAETHQAGLVLAMLVRNSSDGVNELDVASIESMWGQWGAGVRVRAGQPGALGLDEVTAEMLRNAALASTDQPVQSPVQSVVGGVSWLGLGDPPKLAAYLPKRGEYAEVSVVLQGARDAVLRLYVLFTITMLAVYGLVAAALELFVLPRAVYQPIERMLSADAALQSGDRHGEIIPGEQIPADELGEIMRSRNESVLTMRRQEADLADALRRLEHVANDLARKNHLLEMAKQNLADADRLASLGMMSAGIAHELNTPLAVIKGLVEKLNAPESRDESGNPSSTPEQAALMLRVVARLERLSESLLDFARVRPPTSTDTPVRPLVDEAWTLVRLDREARRVEFSNRVPDELLAYCDADRIVQVLVNILRNAVDAATNVRGEGGPIRLEVTGEAYTRGEARWASITISDNGPGIAPEMLARLFQPFVSTRLDAKGTGLGLAVAEGIVREHGGVILARNKSKETGAEFEVVLPRQPGIAHLPASQTSGDR